MRLDCNNFEKRIGFVRNKNSGKNVKKQKTNSMKIQLKLVIQLKLKVALKSLVNFLRIELEIFYDD
jgi:hypothetical protein